MNLRSSYNSAYRALMRNKMRSFLTSIGIIIGVSSVIMMVGLGSSAKIEVRNRIQSYGSNGVSINYLMRRPMPEKDFFTIRKMYSQIQYITPYLRFRNTPVVYSGIQSVSVAYGVNNDYFYMRDWQLTMGRYFMNEEIASSGNVVIIGSTVHKKFFGYYNPINKIIYIGKRPYRIIGVLAETGTSLAGDDFDNTVLMPYTTTMMRFYGDKRIDGIHASAVTEEGLDEMVRNLYVYFRNLHKLTPGQPDDFRIETSKDKLKMADSISQTLSYLLAGVASISLLVGGVGIMNIMLVSVSERTREIGIRMAVGAKKRDILMQFLIESMTLSFVGGTVGIIIGLIGYYFIIRYLAWAFVFSVFAVFISFVFSAAIGIFFGFYPARKAAAMKPIDALRYE
jgi:putative ABC transport system permease protein